MKNKKRKSIGGEERFLTVVHVLSMTMEVLIGAAMFIYVLWCNSDQVIEWHCVLNIFFGLLAFLFWYWLGSMTGELLEYYSD